jgi:acyl carrier protein
MVLEKLQNIFRDIFDDETLILNRETTADDIKEWDSLAQINIISVCESEFGVKYELDEIVSFKNAGDMIDITEEKLNTGRV